METEPIPAPEQQEQTPPQQETPPEQQQLAPGQQEQPAQEEPPAAPTLAELLAQNADYQSQYDALLSGEKQQWEAQIQQRMDAMRVDWALSAALKAAGARNDKVVLALIDREQIKVDGETVTGVTEQLEALQKSDPYLFQNNGGRPYFSAGSYGQNPASSDDAVIAARYRNNPFYHG